MPYTRHTCCCRHAGCDLLRAVAGSCKQGISLELPCCMSPKAAHTLPAITGGKTATQLIPVSSCIGKVSGCSQRSESSTGICDACDTSLTIVNTIHQAFLVQLASLSDATGSSHKSTQAMFALSILCDRTDIGPLQS